MIDKIYRLDWRPKWREKYGEYQQYAKVYKDAIELLSTDMLGVIYDGFIHDLKWTIII